MNEHYVEYWQASNNTTSVAGDIARHLQVRQSLGSAIILTEQPVVLLSSVRKHWIKLSKLLQTERARTLDASLRAVLTQEIETMEKLRFAAKPPHTTSADVFFIEPKQANVTLPAGCRTLYTNNTSVHDYEQLAQQIPGGSVIVQYELHKK